MTACCIRCRQAMARDHGSQCGFCTPGIVMSLFAHYHECGGATDRADDQRRAGRQSVPLHRLPADRRRGACEACNGARRRPLQRATRRRAGKRCARCDDTRRSVRRRRRRVSLPRRRASNRSPRLYARHPDATIVAGAHRCRAVDHQKAHADRQDHSCRPRRRARRDRGDRRRPCARRDRLAGARRAGAGIDRSRHRRGAAAVRLGAGARRRHGRRQHRQRLADRRPGADADRARRRRSNCGAATSSPADCRWRISFSITASRIASRANSSRRLLVPKLAAGDAFSRLQDHQAHRRGHLGGAGGVLPARSTPAGSSTPGSRSAAWRQSRSARRRSKQRCADWRLSDASRWQAAADAVNDDFTPLTDLRASAAYRRRVAGNLVIKALAEIAGVAQRRNAHHRSPDGCRCRRVTPSWRRRCAMCTKPLPHDSGAKHVQGAAEYIDDIPEPARHAACRRRRRAGGARHHSQRSI